MSHFARCFFSLLWKNKTKSETLFTIQREKKAKRVGTTIFVNLNYKLAPFLLLFLFLNLDSVFGQEKRIMGLSFDSMINFILKSHFFSVSLFLPFGTVSFQHFQKKTEKDLTEHEKREKTEEKVKRVKREKVTN